MRLGRSFGKKRLDVFFGQVLKAANGHPGVVSAEKKVVGRSERSQEAEKGR